MDLGLRDKMVFIAGGSRGIGFATASAFAAEGSKVAFAARDQDSLEVARSRLTELAGKGRVVAIQADMRSETDIARALDTAERELGPIYAAVANVGSGTGQPGYGHLDRELWQAALEVNLLASVLLADAVLPRLAKLRRGSLCFVSSIAGLEALKAPIPYSAAKAGLMAAMKSYAREAGSFGVRVNAIAPGNVLFEGGSWAKKLENPEKRADIENYIRQEVALQRFATPAEIADVLVYMASERASFVTGSTVVVDGGQTRFIC
jgi:3-oxoacyl-[acyl-carrier protein] reductase